MSEKGQIEFRLNGVPHAITVEEDTPLLWVLREDFGLTGTKFGCGIGQCGACTVHLNGAPTRSCITSIAAVAGQDVRTIEGLSESGNHALQSAWEELGVPQCGYCQSGQMMTAAALLSRNRRPTDADIDAEMSGNICRCGTYPRIRAAIRKASELMEG